VPKMKTKKASSKRFKRTGTGKLVYKRQGQTHLAAKKSRRRKRRLATEGEVARVDKKAIERVLRKR